ncbi:hypothetical protein [Rhodalgimonas zhirmunskyi]|nr:hypothetical protein [Rhodoalgimonas zhirmunskyi]
MKRVLVAALIVLPVSTAAAPPENCAQTLSDVWQLVAALEEAAAT